MKNKIVIGLICGACAGIVDVIPMLAQNLTWDANCSAFSMWIVIGFLIATSNLTLHPILKGVLISVLSVVPVAFIIAWHEPFSLIPISAMTLILGGLLGFFINKLTKNKLNWKLL